MQYRHLGRSGLRVSTLSLGSWVTYHTQVDTDQAQEMMAAAYDAGVNFFDNAEAYAGGRSEEIMGAALKQLAWPRLNYIVSTKFFWGLDRTGEAIKPWTVLSGAWAWITSTSSTATAPTPAHRSKRLCGR